ncbi:hypothetical protein NDU88_013108 [Pleurodeles waltl]|uniref:Uncharacterized protein n=1 Tax=Pleurodeles waltl TaxID=8319 RepID=A0AAV7R3P8_PLEWA|nr:hypothetical protein NDU88_013108 [Pleurodeles waltl]
MCNTDLRPRTKRLPPHRRTVFPPMRAETPVDKLDPILQDIRDSREIMEQKLGAITTDLHLLKNDQHKLVDMVKSAERTLATLAPAREWLDQNFQGPRSGQQRELASQSSGLWSLSACQKQDAVQDGGGPSLRPAHKSQLEAIQLATNLRDPNHRSNSQLICEIPTTDPTRN